MSIDRYFPPLADVVGMLMEKVPDAVPACMEAGLMKSRLYLRKYW